MKGGALLVWSQRSQHCSNATVGIIFSAICNTLRHKFLPQCIAAEIPAAFRKISRKQTNKHAAPKTKTPQHCFQNFGLAEHNPKFPCVPQQANMLSTRRFFLAPFPEQCFKASILSWRTACDPNHSICQGSSKHLGATTRQFLSLPLMLPVDPMQAEESFLRPTTCQNNGLQGLLFFPIQEIFAAFPPISAAFPPISAAFPPMSAAFPPISAANRGRNKRNKREINKRPQAVMG